MTKERLITLIDGIATNEKFKQDAFFFCGYPTDKPNEKLMRACNKYVDAANEGDVDAETKDGLIAELEAALAQGSEVEGVKNMHSNEAEIKEILENKSML